MKLQTEYALHFGIEKREGLWKVTMPHPRDPLKILQAFFPQTKDDDRIGKEIDGLYVANPGARILQVVDWLHHSITKYPFEWKQQGDSLNPFSPDFEIETSKNKDGEMVTFIEMTELAFLSAKKLIGVEPPKDTEEEVKDDDILPGGGAYVKLHITFECVKPVSEITITPFVEYPMDVVSISYEKDIDTFQPRKEINLFEQNTTSSNTMVFSFQTVTAKRMTFIFRQRNYTQNTYLTSQVDMMKKEMWNSIKSSEVDAMLDTNGEIIVPSKEQLIVGERNVDMDWAGKVSHYKKLQMKQEVENRIAKNNFAYNLDEWDEKKKIAEKKGAGK